MGQKVLTLIAEPEKEFRMGIVESLKYNNHFDIIESVNFRDTIKKMLEFRPEILILSLDMQHKFQLMDFLRNRKPECFIVVYQEKLLDVSVSKYSNYGVSQVLTRDIAMKQIINILTENFTRIC